MIRGYVASNRNMPRVAKLIDGRYRVENTTIQPNVFNTEDDAWNAIHDNTEASAKVSNPDNYKPVFY